MGVGVVSIPRGSSRQLALCTDCGDSVVHLIVLTGGMGFALADRGDRGCQIGHTWLISCELAIGTHYKGLKGAYQ